MSVFVQVSLTHAHAPTKSDLLADVGVPAIENSELFRTVRKLAGLSILARPPLLERLAELGLAVPRPF